MKRLLIIAVIFFLFSCAAPTKRYGVEKYDSLKPGTNCQELIQLFGMPTTTTNADNGLQIWIWKRAIPLEETNGNASLLSVTINKDCTVKRINNVIF